MRLRRLHVAALSAALLAGVVCATPGSAVAQMDGWRGGVSLTLDSRYGHVTDAAASDDREHIGSVGVSLRALASKWWLLYGAGLDYQLGGTSPGGFLYQVDLYPVGAGVLIGPNAKVGIFAGVGLSGVTERVPFSFQAPVECAIEFDLHRRVRVAAFGRVLWLSDNSRDDGSPSLSFADEVAAGLSLRWGKRYYPHDNSMSAGNGYFVGLLYQEQLGSTIIGATFGYSLNASFGRF